MNGLRRAWYSLTFQRKKVEKELESLVEKGYAKKIIMKDGQIEYGLTEKGLATVKEMAAADNAFGCAALAKGLEFRLLAIRRAEVLLSRIKAQQGQLSLLERCELSEEERGSVEKMKGELRELERDAVCHINLLKGDG